MGNVKYCIGMKFNKDDWMKVCAIVYDSYSDAEAGLEKIKNNHISDYIGYPHEDFIYYLIEIGEIKEVK